MEFLRENNIFPAMTTKTSLATFSAKKAIAAHIYVWKKSIHQRIKKRTNLHLVDGGEAHMYGENTIKRRLNQWMLKGLGREIDYLPPRYHKTGTIRNSMAGGLYFT